MHTNAEISALVDPHRLAHIPDFATHDAACFKELRPVLLAMGCRISDELEATIVRLLMGDIGWQVIEDGTDGYAAAVTAAFSWAMDNQPEALRRACEEVG